MASRKVKRRRRTLTFVVLLALGIWWFVSCSGVKLPVKTSSSSSTSSANAFAAQLALPTRAAGLTDADLSHNSVSTLVDPAWVAATAKASGIPARALTAYAGVTLGLSVVKPNCHLSWNTLAGIGWVESRHGTIFGGSIQPNGNAVPDIFGIPLDGSQNTQKMTDFDGGNFDGTADFDRAVGPMQIVPRTWAAWHSDGNNDGDENGQNIDDTALAAGRYLCYSAGDMATQEGWQKGIWSYNQVPKYMTDVANKANEYASAIR